MIGATSLHARCKGTIHAHVHRNHSGPRAAVPGPGATIAELAGIGQGHLRDGSLGPAQPSPGVWVHGSQCPLGSWGMATSRVDPQGRAGKAKLTAPSSRLIVGPGRGQVAVAYS